MRRALLPVLALLALLAVIAGGGSGVTPPAGAAGATLLDPVAILDEPLAGASGTTAIACQASYRPGTAGVATKSVSVGSGLHFLQVTLAGAKGDWDVAVFDASGGAVVASAERGSSESATGWTASGGTLRVQVCRRTGSAASVPVVLEAAEVTGDADRMRNDPPQMVDVMTPTREAKDRLMALGMDMTEHGGPDSLGVILHGEDDRAKLRKAGLEWNVLIDDLIAQGAQHRRQELRALSGRRQAAGTILPSGRTGTYRTLADYNSEMKALAEANPDLVRTFVMPNKTWLGKDVMGLEVAKDVTAEDGRPAFFNMGVHHAREWPAGEMPMEWAYELVNSFKAGDARAVKVMTESRSLIVPIVNPDGFEASRTAGQLSAINMGAGNPEAVPDTAYLVAGATTGGEYRRKNCRLPDNSEAGNCLTSAGIAEPGVDPNRNYGGLWGGPGADADDVSSQTYRGPGPFSEPETRNIQSVVSTNQVMSLLTNHTTAALVLRAPGLASLGDPVDENKGYKALGDAMAKETGYFSQNGFELYDTTGTTEDWSYNATGGFGFTIEIYCGAPDYETGDCADPAFHPTFNTGVEREWNGDNPTADHEGDPAGAYDGRGMREAYYIAAESAINEERHSVLEGTAPAGATLRVTKSFKTETFPQPPDEKPLTFDDKLDTTIEVGSDGRYEWHINPSTRPIVAKDSGKMGAGPASPEEVTVGGLQGSSETADDPDDGAAVPDPSGGGAPPTTSYNDHPFTIPAGDNASLSVNVEWTTPASDWDVILFEDVDGNGKSDPAVDKSITTSAQGTTNFEEVSIANAAVASGKKYVLRVVNFAVLPTDPTYNVTKTYEPFEPFQAARQERWTLTCEVGGKVLQTERILIERGQRMTPDLSACAGQVPSGGRCDTRNGFRSVGVKPRGAGALLAFKKRAGVGQPVRIDIFKPGTAKKVLRTRKVRKFAASRKSVEWNGEDKRGRMVGPGYYFVRYLVKVGRRTDVRRVVLQRSNGRFRVLRAFDRRDNCSALRQFKLSKPVFGGSTGKPLSINYRLATTADIEVLVRRGSKVISRFKRADQPAGRLLKLRLKPKGLRRGDYTVSLRATAGTRTITARAVARRI